MSWLDDDSIYSIFNKPNHRGPGTHFDEDKAHVSSKPIPASGGVEKEVLLMNDFMPTAAEVKKEANELFNEVGNQGGHAGNTAADSGDEDDTAPARGNGRGGKRENAGRKPYEPELKTKLAATRAEHKEESKAIEKGKVDAIKKGFEVAVAPEAAAVGGAGGPAAVGKPKIFIGPGGGRRSAASSRRGSFDSEAAEELAAAAPKAVAAEKTTTEQAKQLFYDGLNIKSDASKEDVKGVLDLKGTTISKLTPLAKLFGIQVLSQTKKSEIVEALLRAVFK